MAVLDELPGLVVEILVNGEPLKEYTDTFVDEKEPNTIIKYIEAVSGANFEIRCRFIHQYPHRDVLNGVDVRLDGQNVACILIHKSDLRQMVLGYTTFITGRTSGQGQKWIKEKFRFAELTIGEHISFPSPLKRLAD